MSSKQPFLEYADDPDKEEARQLRHISSPRNSHLLPYFMVCVATSFFWAALFLLFNPAEHHVSSSSSMMMMPEESAGHTHHLTEFPPSAAAASARHNITSGARRVDCGSNRTAAEARAKGCRYDVLLNSWVPAQCFDQEFVDLYTAGSRTLGSGFADEALTQKLTVDEMQEREFFWTSAHDHMHHCSMVWKKQFWVLFEGRKAFDTVIASPEHTDHCAQWLVDPSMGHGGGEGKQPESTHYNKSTKTEVGYAGCWIR